MGDNPFTVIENPEVSNGQSGIVVKESFGNAFVPDVYKRQPTPPSRKRDRTA